jgi:hypothetical protein
MPATLDDERINLVGLEDIEDGGRGGIAIKKVRPGEAKSLKTRFRKGDILFGKLRPYLNKVGIAPADGLCSTEIWAFSTKPFVDPYFVYVFLSSTPCVERISAMAKGANLPRLSSDAFQSLEIPLPPLSEQRRIAEVLLEAQKAQRLSRSADAPIDGLISGCYRELFLQSKERERWEEFTIAEVSANKKDAIRTGPFGSDLLHT